MDINNIRELADIMSRSDLTKIAVKEGNLNITLKRKATTIAPNSIASDAAAVNIDVDAAERALDERESINFNKLIEVKSPIVGVFYASPSPESKPYVSIGSKVKKGDILCIIESMKLMNEILAEHDGEIADVCLKNGDVAEYGQVIFKKVKN